MSIRQLSCSPLLSTCQAVAVGLLAWTACTGAVRADSAGLFARLDQDGDGQLATGEIAPDKRSWFERLVRNGDTNGDAQLTTAEFASALQPHRPERPLPQKGDAELPGSDALLLLLARMDKNADMTIESREVTDSLQPMFRRFANQLGPQFKNKFRVNQLRAQAPRFANQSRLYAARQGIDVELELALLDDAHFELVQRIKRPVRPGEGLANRDNARAIFARLDQAGTGTVDLAGLPEKVRERIGPLLTRADRNADGQLTEQEFLAFQSRISQFLNQGDATPGVARDARPNPLLRRLDQNRDGILSREEIPAQFAERFDRADANGDDRLDSQELSRAARFLRQLLQEHRTPTDRISSEKAPSPAPQP